MTIGGSWDDAPLDARTVDRARAAVRAALDAGITDFDHADIYAHGKSEEVFGLLLREDPELGRRVVVQTKCGVRLPGNTAAPAPRPTTGWTGTRSAAAWRAPSAGWAWTRWNG